MAYLDRTTDPGRRTTAITGVLLIHAVLVYVLVTGLVQTFVPHPRDTFTGYITPEVKPPPKPQPEKAHESSARPERETVQTRRTELTKTDDTIAGATDLNHEVEVTPTATATYTPPTSLGLRPKAAAPRNEPAR